MSENIIKKELHALKDPEKAEILSRFFKTGKGQYGEGDIFLGIKMPKQRIIAKKYIDTDLDEIQKLLTSPVHEHRMVALLILTYKYPKSTEKEKKKIVEFYLSNTKYINNWDLVDVTTPKIVGEYLLYKPNERKILYNFAKSANLWKRRIAILSTFTFIRNRDFKDAFKISEILVNDKHDLIHKAVGWMLREIGKKDLAAEENFLQKHYRKMPRTMLLYAIERFPEEKRKHYMETSK
jgi:3-methyladenine DNA glycosylase AlkD